VKLKNTGPDSSDWKDNAEYKFILGELPYKIGDSVATRNAYGNALKRLGDNDPAKRIVVCDADVKNSTFSETFMKSYPKNFVECFIAE
jgi:transketolase